MWAKLDDGWWLHPKVLPLPMDVRGLWATALSYAGQQRSPNVSAAWVHLVCGIADDGKQLAQQLVDVGLWEVDEDGDGWVFHDWEDCQKVATSDKRSESGKIGGLTRALNEAQARAEAAERALAAQTEQAPSKQTQAPAKQTASTVSDPPKHGPEPEPEPEPNPEPQDQTHVAASVDDAADDGFALEVEEPTDDGFEDFWGRYPRHDTSGKPGGGGSKAKARKRWQRMSAPQRQQALIGVAHYADFQARDGSPFVAHATTWLNEQRWETWQEPAAPVARGSPAHVSEFDGETREVKW